MDEKTLHLAKEGVYLFRAPHKLTATVDDELVVVFSVPSAGATGVVVHDPRRPLHELRSMLDGVFEKITLGLDIGTSPVHVKLFGVSNGSRAVLDPLRAWLHTNGLEVTAKDLGRNVARSLYIDCGSGAVGVRYSEAYVPEAPQFLSRGSARERGGYGQRPPAEHQVLVLAESPTARTLARQVIEESPLWTATAPESPLETIAENDFKSAFPWDFVMLFEDAAAPSLVGNWLEALSKAHPSVTLLWVGSAETAHNHRFPAGVRLLPALTPETIVEFKDAFHQADGDRRPPADTWHAGDVIPFPRQGRK